VGGVGVEVTGLQIDRAEEKSLNRRASELGSTKARRETVEGK